MIVRFFGVAVLLAIAFVISATFGDLRAQVPGAREPMTDSMVRSVVRLEVEGTGPGGHPQTRVGTGLVVSTDGYVLTANHNLLWQGTEDFVGDAKITVEVLAKPGPPASVRATISRQNRTTDLALLKLG